MSSNEIFDPNSYSFVPLVRQSGRFIEAPDDLIAEGTDLSSALQGYIERNYKTVEGQVEVDGHLYTSTIYIPNKGSDLSFVLTDENRIPVGTELPALTADEVNQYLLELRQRLSKSEGIVPDQVIDVRSQFIRPDFIDLKPLTSGEERVSWDGFLHRGRMVLLGAPGSGKTTCLRRMALEFSDPENLKEPPFSIPIYLQMRDFADTSLGIETIQRALMTQHGRPLTESFSKLSESGQFLLLFDGLDEVTEQERDRLAESIRNITHLFPQNRVVISTRKAAYRWQFPDYTHLEIQPFTLPQIKEWSCQNLHNKRSWKLFFTYLNESEELLEVIKNPLLLSLTTAMFVRQSVTPHNLTTLLKHFVKALIEDWDSTRSIVRHKSRWTAPHRLYPILCNLSFECRKAGQVSFSTEDVIKWRKDPIERIPARQLLDAVSEISGLISQTASDKWVFKHKLVMDYLAAQYLVASTVDAEVFFVGKLSDELSKDVWSLAAAITYDADHLFDVVTKSNEITSIAKALLVARALVEDVEITKTALDKCCAIVVRTLEFFMKEMTIDESSKSAATVDHATLWSLIVSSTESSLADTARVPQLRQLLRLIYKCRSGPAKESLMDQLSRSKVQAVSALSSVFDTEGEFVDRIIQTDSAEKLVISINRPSPELEE